MANEVKIFENADFGRVRTIEEGDKILFCGSDVAKSLGYSNTADAISRHCRCIVKHDIPHPQSENKSMEVSFISEGDVYRLITHSKLPSAEKFEKWVFDEILPTIRKHGAYMTDETLEKALLSPEFLIRLAQELQKEKEMRIAAENKIKADEPKVAFADRVADTSNVIDIGLLSKLAKDEHIDIGRNRLFAWLRENEYLQNSDSHKNEPYQKYVNQGIFEVKEYTYSTPYGEKSNTKTYVTGKGQIYLIEKLRKAFP